MGLQEKGKVGAVDTFSFSTSSAKIAALKRK